MHKMSKESATTLAGLQSRLNEAERILKTILEEEDVTSREYLVALTTTYFSHLRHFRKEK